MSFLSSDKHPKAWLLLENGRFFSGRRFGFLDSSGAGELVFNTALCGYQEIMTDPSYAGQLVLMTYPHQGNYGMSGKFTESHRPWCEAFICRQWTLNPSHPLEEENLEDYLIRWKIPGFYDCDTRAITHEIREQGAMRAFLCDEDPRQLDSNQRNECFRSIPPMSGLNLTSKVSPEKPYDMKSDKTPNGSKSLKVGVLDFGVKTNSLKLLLELGCDLKVLPASSTAEEIKALQLDGLFLSNGPGDPATMRPTVTEVKKLLGKLPLFGICMGHQILAQALGGKTYKLSFGHRGANHPVFDRKRKKVEITSQNHGFAVLENSMEGNTAVTHHHLNDETVAGIECDSLGCFSVQYHPESSPGPHDSRHLFERFIQTMHSFPRGRNTL
jgi:carbamoyl-phosphate synthase small subunit